MYNFSTHSQEYEKALGRSHEYFIRVKCKELLRSLRRLNYNPQKVLDLGCGTGEVERTLYRHFDEMTGIDLSEGIINEAKRKNIPKCKFKQANVLKLPLPNDYFDFVFSFCLLHHLPANEWEQVLKEAMRVSKKSSIILIFEHNPKNPVTRYIVSKSPIDEGITLISVARLVELYKALDIKVLARGFILFFPRFLSFLSPIEGLLHKVPYGGQYYIVGLVKNG